MKGHSPWNYHPYSRLNQLEKRTRPFLCRLAPQPDALELEWFDAGSAAAHWVQYRPRGDNDWARLALSGSTATIPGLQPERDYELQVIREDGSAASDIRLARTGAYVGVVVNYLHPEDEIYAFSGRSLCSPSLVRLPSGALLASMDVFSGDAPQNLSLLFRSDDDGQSWRYLVDLFPCFWGKLFWHQDALFMLANATEYGSLLIGKSLDEGRT